jgi:transposase
VRLWHSTSPVDARARMRRGCPLADPGAGDRIKTDRRDAASLARLHRPGELSAVWVADTGHEAIRDLVRARLDAVLALRRARQRLLGFLLRQGCHYGRPALTKLHRRWLADLKFEQAARHLVLEDYLQTVEAAEARRDRLTAQIEAMLRDWTLAPVVAALQTMRGTGDVDRRVRRPLALRQSAPADGLLY